MNSVGRWAILTIEAVALKVPAERLRAHFSRKITRKKSTLMVVLPSGQPC